MLHREMFTKIRGKTSDNEYKIKLSIHAKQTSPQYVRSEACGGIPCGVPCSTSSFITPGPAAK